MSNDNKASQPNDMQLELESCREKLREALGTIATLKYDLIQPVAAAEKRLTEQQIKEMAAKHAYNLTFDANYSFDPHGLDAFALEIMDKLRAPADQAASVDLWRMRYLCEAILNDCVVEATKDDAKRMRDSIDAAQSADKPAMDLSALPVYYMEGLENGGYYLRTDVNRALAVSASADGSEAGS